MRRGDRQRSQHGVRQNFVDASHADGVRYSRGSLRGVATVDLAGRTATRFCMQATAAGTYSYRVLREPIESSSRATDDDFGAMTVM
jgi:hypothetical protein